jgi:uncharacterized membrane protein
MDSQVESMIHNLLLAALMSIIAAYAVIMTAIFVGWNAPFGWVAFYGSLLVVSFCPATALTVRGYRKFLVLRASQRGTETERPKESSSSNDILDNPYLHEVEEEDLVATGAGQFSSTPIH